MTPQAQRLAMLERLGQRMQTGRIRALRQWLQGLPEDRIGPAVELLTIALDATRGAQTVALATIAEDFIAPEGIVPHEDRVALLRWIAATNEGKDNVRAKLDALVAAGTTERRRIVDSLSVEESVTSFDDAHPLLTHAWRAAPPDARPKGPFHRGELRPFIGGKGPARLTVRCARRVARLVPKSDERDFEELLDLATTALERGSASVAALRAAAQKGAKTGASALARWACMETATAFSRPDTAGGATRHALTRAIELILESEGKTAVRSFLLDVDEELRRLDVVCALEARKKTPSKPIRSAIHRGGEKGKVVLWFAELEGGSLGLLAKQGRLWTWSEGERDVICAMIPDAHFETAVNHVPRRRVVDVSK